MLEILKRWHRRVSLAGAAVLLFWIGSGLYLNHRDEAAAWRAFAARPGAPRAGEAAGEVVWRSAGASLFQSSDGGRTWTAAVSPAGGTLADVAYDPTGRTLYALAREGVLYRTDNEGLVWDKSVMPTLKDGSLPRGRRVGVLGGGTVWVTADEGLLCSGDGGRTWAWDGAVRPRIAGRLLHDLHTGWLFGPHGVTLYDFAAAALVGSVATGFWLSRRMGAGVKT